MEPTNQGFHSQWSENAENASTTAWVGSLLEKLSTGDRTAFWPLWENYQDYLYHRCCSWMGGNRFQAQDALSEIMLKAWEKLPKFAAKITNLKGWLTKFGHNFCIDCHRENNSGAIGVENLEAIAVAEGNGLVTEFDTPGKIVENSELLEVIRSALEDLPENQREVCLLHFEQELSYQEIAQRLDISNNTVRKRIQRAREKLQQSLQTYLGGLDEKAYGEIALLDAAREQGGTPCSLAASLLKEIRRVSEQQSKEEKDRESHVTPADKEIEQGDLETTEQSLRKTEISEDGEIVNKSNYSGVAELNYQCAILWFWASPLNPPILRCDPRAIYSPIGKRTGGDFESLVPPKIGGLGGLNHTHNQQHHYPDIKLETTAEEITSLVEPESVVPKVISIKKAPNPPSTKFSDSNPCPMDWVKPRSLKAMGAALLKRQRIRFRQV
ncbi:MULTISPECIES: sigma-70 family RNA polymerase sigma factor [unclassified Moorena]|uniref:RNA polymerase sigma factor n=1 Tax=unclassified Moorena TaxID=2683338 RepID=UPI0025D74787|nr:MULTISPECIES: sigma-70 family RNA polymerase sigma factor [unclassified Moorena]